MLRRDVFQAIADPTRREIIGMLAHKSLNINNVADEFAISRPAISKHMKILTECGLVTITKQGRENYCHADFGKLKEVADWTARYQKFWTEKLDALGAFLDLENEQNIDKNPDKS
ncbi:MAG: metalloregulator ArsR/SmtB family transcription factor [Bacteroidota bacterium]